MPLIASGDLESDAAAEEEDDGGEDGESPSPPPRCRSHLEELLAQQALLVVLGEPRVAVERRGGIVEGRRVTSGSVIRSETGLLFRCDGIEVNRWDWAKRRERCSLAAAGTTWEKNNLKFGASRRERIRQGSTQIRRESNTNPTRPLPEPADPRVQTRISP